MKKFTALHLADMRLRRADEQIHAPVLHALFQDLAALCDAGTQIDAIFFTGELVAPDACAGTTPAYVYEYLLRPLLQAASLPGARFYLVPGSRFPGGTAVNAGRAGFSFFSAGEYATAEQRALYKNIHAVFHGNNHTGDSSSLMKSLGILFKSSPASLYGGPAQRAAYALLEYDAEAAGAQWTVALREFDEAGKAFLQSVLYTPNGHESAERDAEYVFSTLLPQLARDGACLDGLLGKHALSRQTLPDDPQAAREFLIELAFVLFDARTLFLQQDELERFASDYCAVKGWDLPAEQWLAPLYAKGLLLQADGQVVFAYDYFRTYFLAQRFETSFGLMPYGPQRRDGMVAVLQLDGRSAARPFLSALGVESEPSAPAQEVCKRS
ncbi:STAND family AAA ATPase [Janthinobacterium sp. RB2R34]|uniref:STAND family AAA ATPase n=1 Tax=Janthinobacterium sp. RB2R34 TaxID=3424193 RepID=UPI003F231C7C